MEDNFSGHWKLESGTVHMGPVIGKGQFGEVRIASWNNTTVAAKSLVTSSSTNTTNAEERLELFYNEIEAMAHLRHPCIVQFFGWYQSVKGEIFILMEHYPVGDLEAYVLKNYSSTSKTLRLQWCDEMAQALHAIHVSGTVHRDIKPANFLLTNALSIKLADFGISKDVTSAPSSEESESNESSFIKTPTRKAWRGRREFLARPVSKYVKESKFLSTCSPDHSTYTPQYHTAEHTSNCGTARWMAPEVYSSSDTSALYTEKIDIFSVGMVMYFVWEGELPHIEGIANKQAHVEAIYTPRTRPPFARGPLAVQQVIKDCIRFEPVERPSSHELLLLLRGVDLDCGSFWAGLMPAFRNRKQQNKGSQKVVVDHRSAAHTVREGLEARRKQTGTLRRPGPLGR